MEITDPMELQVAQMLNNLKIKYIHEGIKNGVNQRLDFYIPEFDVYIECKQMHSERTISQLSSAENIILIQGKQSIKFLEKLLLKK